MKTNILLLLSFLCTITMGYAQPKLEVTTKEHNFGTIASNGGVVTYTFTVINNGTSPAVILDAKVACKCTKISFPKKPIAAKESKNITVTYDPKGESGSFMKAIQLISNTSIPLIVTIKGTVY